MPSVIAGGKMRGWLPPSCHADPNWPAPCEYEEEGFDNDYEDHYTYEDLGPNWY